MTKSELRKEMLKKRRELGEGRVSAFSEKICGRIIASDEYARAQVIFIYSAVNGEADLSALALRAKRDGKITAYPVCRDETAMDAYAPDDGTVFVGGMYGIAEPDIEHASYIRPGEIDLVICPLTAFDDSCRRLGMGGGYYDRFIPKCVNAVIAAAAYEMQKADAVPTEETDIAVDVVFTEKGEYRRA